MPDFMAFHQFSEIRVLSLKLGVIEVSAFDVIVDVLFCATLTVLLRISTSDFQMNHGQAEQSFDGGE